MTLYDFGMEITKIREAINQLEVKGQQNASLIVYAHNKCNELIKLVNTAAVDETQIQNGDSEEGGTDGEPDRGTVE